MNIGAAANSLNFFVLCIVQVILGGAVLSYAAHSFLTILVDTAAGTDRVIWPKEPFTDWLWKPWYLAWVTAVWLTPLALVLALFKFNPIQISLISLGLFWLAMPVGLLSSLSASSRWIVFRPLIVWYMLRHIGSTVVFYVATEFLVLAWGATVYFTFRSYDELLLYPLTALVVTALLFLYGRLLGRLAWVINQRKLGRQEEAEEIAAEAEVQDPWSTQGTEADRPETIAEEEKVHPRKKRRARVVDPWAVPPPEEDPDYWKKGLPLDVQTAGGYDILTAEPPPPLPHKPVKKKPRQPKVYAAEPVAPPKPDTKSIVPEVPKREKELAEHTIESPPPALPMFSGVYSFLGYSETLGPLLAVSLGLWLMGLVLRLQLSFLRF